MADLSNISWKNFPADAAPDDLVSKNFQFYELTKSDIASRQGIPNGFASENELRCAVYLCRKVMQPVRDKFGRFKPNSVYRSQALERTLKDKPANWISSSQHVKGQACDIEVLNASNIKLALWVRDNLKFDQLILECYAADEGANSGWVHVSLLPQGYGKNRKEILSYVKNPQTGQFEYVPGLVETP
jgi:hypothetical protein